MARLRLFFSINFILFDKYSFAHRFTLLGHLLGLLPDKKSPQA